MSITRNDHRAGTSTMPAAPSTDKAAAYGDIGIGNPAWTRREPLRDTSSGSQGAAANASRTSSGGQENRKVSAGARKNSRSSSHSTSRSDSLGKTRTNSPTRRNSSLVKATENMSLATPKLAQRRQKKQQAAQRPAMPSPGPTAPGLAAASVAMATPAPIMPAMVSMVASVQHSSPPRDPEMRNFFDHWWGRVRIGRPPIHAHKDEFLALQLPGLQDWRGYRNFALKFLADCKSGAANVVPRIAKNTGRQGPLTRASASSARRFWYDKTRNLLLITAGQKDTFVSMYRPRITAKGAVADLTQWAPHPPGEAYVLQQSDETGGLTP